MPPDPLILAFDTSAAHCAAALLSGDRVLGEFFIPMAKGQAEHLFPLLEDLLKEAEKSWADLDRIGVGIGPGNFTGIRISVAAARGLALSLDIPAIGVSTFSALALDAPRPVLVALDARADHYYFQQFLTSGETPAGLLKNPEIPKSLDPGLCTVIGDAAKDLAVLIGAQRAEPKHGMAVAIGRIAGAANASKTSRPAPLYLRSADAAPSREKPPVILDQ